MAQDWFTVNGLKPTTPPQNPPPPATDWFTSNGLKADNKTAAPTEPPEPSWRTNARSILLPILAQSPVLGPMLQHPKVVNTILDVMGEAKDHPAAAGAIVGGLAAAPITGGMSMIPAAVTAGGAGAIGAGIGMATSDAITGNKRSAIDAAKEMGTQAALAATGEVGGRALAYGIGKVAPVASEWLYKLGLRPSASVAGKFPTATSTGLSEGVIPTAEKVQARLSEVEQGLNQLVNQADAARPAVRGLLGPAQPTTVEEAVPLANVVTTSAPTPIVKPRTTEEYAKWTEDRIANRYAPRPQANTTTTQPGGVLVRSREVPPELAAPTPNAAPPTMVATKDLADQARAFVMDKANLLSQGGRGLRADSVKELDTLIQKYLSENPAPMSVAETLSHKRAEQGLASASYLTEARGGEVNQIETLFHQGLANAARQQVIDRVPEAAEALATEQGLIGLKQMATVAANRPAVLGRYVKAAAVIGGVVSGRAEEGLATAALMAAVESPTLTGAMGIATKKLGKAGASQLTPAIAKALAAAYGGSK